jgi:hypothetical protein
MYVADVVVLIGLCWYTWRLLIIYNVTVSLNDLLYMNFEEC